MSIGTFPPPKPPSKTDLEQQAEDAARWRRLLANPFRAMDVLKPMRTLYPQDLTKRINDAFDEEIKTWS